MAFLRWVGGVVVLFWLIGFIFNIAGGLIHALLIIAAAMFLIDWFKTRKIKNKINPK